jgi:hypothetical protein
MSYTIVSGNLLDADVQYIAQQNCCTACKAHGLSEDIARKLPELNPYKNRRKIKGKNNWAILEDRPEVGSIEIYEFEDNCLPSVICMFAQYCHGKPGIYKDPLGLDGHDTAKDRLRYFKECLAGIATLKPESVGFPYKIGCGLAGGDWKLHESEIKRWSIENSIHVKVYKLE